MGEVGDIAFAAIGVLLARRFGLWWSIAFVGAIEIVLIVWIRDSLLINIVMLIHPIDTIRAWQAGR